MLRTTILSLALWVLAIASADAKGHSGSKRSHDLALAERTQGPDHPDWNYLNAMEWYNIDPTAQDHMRFHAYLSMSVYGDYQTLCPKTFTQGFTVLQTFSADGQDGYVAKIPQMNKIVIVFKGNSAYSTFDWTPTSISSLVSNCAGCTVGKSVYDSYMAVKKATNNWAVAKAAVKSSGLLFSVTGHGYGGAVSALAGLDLGATGDVHYSHNQGAMRSMNYAAVVRYDNLFQVLAGQSAVSRNDNIVNLVPRGNFYHVGQKAHITGDLTQWLTYCWGNNENSTCLGNGSSDADHKYYFTPLGECGSANKGF